MASKYELIVVEGCPPLLNGVYVREEGELEWLIRLNPHAFASEEDQKSCATLIADFLTKVQMWS